MWFIGNQFEIKSSNFNREVVAMTRDFNDLEAKITLAKFMRHNIGLSFQLLSGFEMFPIQELIIRGILLKDISLIVAGRGFSKSTMLAILSIIYPMFYSNSSMCVVSSNFRNARRILESSEKIVEGKKAGLLRKCFMENLRRSNDIYRWKLGNGSDVFALPLSCLTYNNLITFDNGIRYIGEDFDNITKKEQFWIDTSDKVWSLGQFRDVAKKFNNGFCDTRKINFRNGSFIEGTLNHKIKIVNNGNIEFKEFKDIKIGDYAIIDRTDKWCSKPKYNFSEDWGYVNGLMVGDGTFVYRWGLYYTDKRGELINNIRNITKWKWVTYDNIHYYQLNVKNKKWFLDEFGVDAVYTKDKTIPKKLFSSNKEAMKGFISGLFDSDGNVQVSTQKGGYGICVRLTNTSRKLIDQIQYVLLHFGIISYINTYWDKKEKHNIKYDLLITGRNVKIFAEKINFRLIYKKELLFQGLSKQVRNNSYENIPCAHNLILNIIDKVKLPYGIRNYNLCHSKLKTKKNINHVFLKKFLNYYYLYASHLLEFKQLELLCNSNYFYCPVKSIINNKDYTYDLNIPDNSEYMAGGFLSHNTGEGLRGTRCHHLSQDEKILISKEIEDVILKPFLSVKPNVQEENEIKNAENELIKKGLLKEEDRMSFPKNKYSAFSSASFQFQHLYATYQEYLKAINDANQDKSKPSYFVMRASYEAMPVGQLFDMTQIDDAKKNGGENTEVFKREYRAIFTNANDGYFNVKKLHDCTVRDGDVPTVQLKGEKDSEYILTIDTSYSQSKASDFFAMSVFLLAKEQRKIFQVHTYARAGGSLKDHYNYLTYLLTHFNIVFIGMDASGDEFIHSYNESVIAKDVNIKLKFLNAELDDEPNYLEELQKAKMSYNLNNRTIVYGMKPQSSIIRKANEHLQAQIEASKVWFASKLDADEKNANKYRDLIGKFAIKNKNDEEFGIIDFIDDQNYFIDETKAQVGLIEVKATVLGTLQFDLPQSLRRSDSPNRARKDCYTALLIGNMSASHYYNLIYTPERAITATFAPIIIR